IAGQIADRWLAAERCLTVCSFVAAGLLWLVGSLTSPQAGFAVNLLFWFVMAPSMTLSAGTCFAHPPDPRHEFARVRMWGTVGWVLPGWLLAFWMGMEPMVRTLAPDGPVPHLADAFKLAAVLAVIFGFYTLTLPHTPPQRAADLAAPLAALRLLRGRAFFIYCLCPFGICPALPFFWQVTLRLLESLGVPEAWIALLWTLALASEVAALFVLPAALRRLGVRGTMRLGLAAAVVTLAGLALGRPLPLVLGALALYGLCV